MINKTALRVIVFYSIAITLSNVFRFDLLNLHGFIEKLPTWTMIFISPLEAIGVIIGALLSLNLLKKERTITISFFGTSLKWSLLMSLVPVILLTIIGVKGFGSENPHYYGFIAGVSTFIYCFCEEIGWRGYLGEELNSISFWKRGLIIAVFWYVWHLSFLMNPDILNNLKFFGWLLVGSWGISKLVELTKSVFVATCFHMVINIIMFNGFIKDSIDFKSKIIILCICIAAWVPVLIKWSKEKKASVTTEPLNS